MDTLVDVLVDDDGEEVTQLAKIVGEAKKTYQVKFLCLHHSGLYRYDKEPTEIDKGCIIGFYDSSDERVAGFVHTEGGYRPMEEYDDDYVPSSGDESDTDTDTDESLVESDSEEENVD